MTSIGTKPKARSGSVSSAELSQNTWHLAGAIALCIVLRVAYLVQLRATPWFDNLSIDPEFYDAWAQRIARGEWLGDRVFYMDPLYPYILGIVYWLCGQNLLLPRLLNIVFSAAS